MLFKQSLMRLLGRLSGSDAAVLRRFAIIAAMLLFVIIIMAFFPVTLFLAARYKVIPGSLMLVSAAAYALILFFLCVLLRILFAPFHGKLERSAGALDELITEHGLAAKDSLPCFLPAVRFGTSVRPGSVAFVQNSG